MHQSIEVKGKVVKGDAIGHTIGFPTANLNQTPSSLKLGVYTGVCLVNETNTTRNCLIYFGPRYISGKPQNSFEVYLYDFQGDLYSLTLTVKIGQFLRSPIKFSNLEELKNQLQKDREHGRLLLSHD